ncbi:hypothetical protein [Leptospira kirschneri]|uniref:hypothetical protein n=1 Tax=Leptospira kirschneri TaxID=29507 RepID=UPI00046C54CF|nr:hypothetical protein [Leptospira kirschneri]
MKLSNIQERMLLFALCIILIFVLETCGLMEMDSGISVNSWRSKCVAEYLLFSNIGVDNLNKPDKKLNDLLLTQLYLCWSLCSENSELQEVIFGKTHCGE